MDRPGEVAHASAPSAASGASADSPGGETGQEHELVLGAESMPGPYPAAAASPWTEAVHACILAQPAPADAQPDAADRTDASPDADDDGSDAQPDAQVHAKAPAPDADAGVMGGRSGIDADELLEEARRLDAAVRADDGRNASSGVSLRQLQTRLHIGQRRAQRLQRLLKQDPQQL
ncbi:hypothetical protein ACFYWP_36700 [Actinacidiphila glaucinigra]|uniref:hypothetical protein n=1 Tax=Actinacidiphila glaucinigra TaxID=235986 RepID=UPI0036C9F214